MTGVRERLAAFLAERPGQRVFPEHEVKGLLHEIGVSVPRGVFAREGEALPPLSPLSFPLVAKTVSRVIASKSEAGGVRLGIGTRASLKLWLSSQSK